jgi:hypothetical protein
MQILSIQSYKTGEILFQGQFKNFKTCLAAAITEKITLAYADLKHKNLVNAQLDDACMPYADFTRSNLSGANLSESMMQGAQFTGVSLHNTCLAYSDLRGCVFENASFGATDVTGSDISFSSFSTLSCFSLDFMHVHAMKNCVFKNPDGTLSALSRPPIVVNGLGCMPLIFLDQHLKIGERLTAYPEWFTPLRDRLQIEYENPETWL